IKVDNKRPPGIPEPVTARRESGHVCPLRRFRLRASRTWRRAREDLRDSWAKAQAIELRPHATQQTLIVGFALRGVADQLTRSDDARKQLWPEIGHCCPLSKLSL